MGAGAAEYDSARRISAVGDYNPADVRHLAYILPLLATPLVACPGTLDDPDRFREAGATTCPPGTDVVKDILLPSCASKICHDSDEPEGMLDLLSPGVESRIVGVTSNSADCSGKVIVDPSDIQGSLFYEKLVQKTPSCGDPMPLGPKRLPAAQIDCIEKWLQQISALDGGGTGGTDAGTGGGPSDGAAE